MGWMGSTPIIHRERFSNSAFSIFAPNVSRERQALSETHHIAFSSASSTEHTPRKVMSRQALLNPKGILPQIRRWLGTADKRLFFSAQRISPSSRLGAKALLQALSGKLHRHPNHKRCAVTAMHPNPRKGTQVFYVSKSRLRTSFRVTGCEGRSMCHPPFECSPDCP